MNLSAPTHLLFDLDGTLTDPAEGITRSVQHALAAFGLSASREELLSFIGSPLIDSFMDRFGLSEEDARRAVAVYREYFIPKGMFENQVYPGVPALLDHLCASGKKLYLATSKPEPFAKEILSHFRLDGYFTFIGGSTLDETRTRKDQVLRYVLEENRIPPEDALLIGDRLHDAEGARAVGIPCIGVLWGYGDRQELSAAGAAAIARDLPELEALLRTDPRWFTPPTKPLDAYAIRQAVFVEEQGFHDEFDDRDASCDHLVLYEKGRPIACARIYPEGDGVWHLGRLAVVRDCRGRDLGRRALTEAEERVKSLGGTAVRLSAQAHARGFYEKQGYRPTSGEYLDQHCPHLDMEKTLTD